MRTRELRKEDFKAWLPLWRGYQAFYETDIPTTVGRASFDRMVGEDPCAGGFVAEDDRGELQGMVHWIDHASNWTLGDYCYLQDLVVNRDLRGVGVGRALIEAVYRSAAERGCDRVYWLTHETNTKAMKLYDKIADRTGFIQYRKVLA